MPVCTPKQKDAQASSGSSWEHEQKALSQSTLKQQLLGAANWPSSRVQAEAPSGHTAGTVTEGEEAGKTIPSLPDATGKEIAFLNTATGSR